MSDVGPLDQPPALRARDFLSEGQCNRLHLALVQTCIDEALDPNDGATVPQCEALLDWAADIVFQYCCVLDIIKHQRGVAVLRGRRPGKYRVAVLQAITDRVIADAMSGGISAAARIG